MDYLEINTVSRKRLDRSALVYGIIAGFLLFGGLIQVFQIGNVKIIEELCRQLGVLSYMSIITWIIMAGLFLVLLRGLRTLIRKRRELNGQFIIQPDSIIIKKNGKEFHLTGEDLQEIAFELKPPKENNFKRIGDSFVHIPSPNGTYRCELDIKDLDSHSQLVDLIDHFEKVHQVKIETKIIA